MGKGACHRAKRKEALRSTAPLEASPPPSGQISCGTGDCVQINLVPRNILTAVVPVIMRSAQDTTSLGTAFSIAHFQSGYSLFVTAKHVVTPNLPAKPGVDILAVLPVHTDPDDTSLQLTGARTVQIAIADDFTDVALLAVDRRTAPLRVFADLRSMPLTFGRPRVGEKCLALGYSDFGAGPLTGDVGAWDFKLRAAQGAIEELHPKKRDDSMIKFPSFRTNAFYEHGMSGGPLVTESGRVLGVVCASYEKENATAYAAVVATIAELSIDIEDLAGKIGEWSVKRLAEDGVLNLDRGSVTLNREPDGIDVSWR